MSSDSSIPKWLRTWCQFATLARADDLPSEVIDRTVQVLYDSVGVIGAGAQEPEIVKWIDRLSLLWGEGGITTPVIGAHRSAPLMLAAMINGTSGTALELDEGSQFARGHPAVHVVPAALAAAGRYGSSGKDLVSAIALGYEICARVGSASHLRPSMHAHGTWGTIGASVAVARLAGATENQMSEVINISSTLGLATSMRTMLQGATVRNTFAGSSNQTGLMVWELVSSGFCGERDGLNSIYGEVISERWDPDLMTDGLGSKWEILRNYFKIHACCRYSHGALDAMAKIIEEHGEIDSFLVDRVDIATYSSAANLFETMPRNALAAKFSLPFSIASMIVNGNASVSSFREDAIVNEKVIEMSQKIFVSESSELSDMLPDKRPAKVSVKLRDGGILYAENYINKGDSANPYTTQEIQNKFLDLAEPVWGSSYASILLEASIQISDFQNVKEYIEMLGWSEK